MDFCLRAHQKGFLAVIDPHTYIFHTKTASFPSNEKKELNLKAHKVLDSKYGKILEKYKTEKYVSRKKLDRVTNNVKHLYKVHSMLYSKFHRPKLLFLVSNITPLGDLISLLNLVFYLKAQQLTVWVQLLAWETVENVHDNPSLDDLLLIHFPDLTLAEREIVFVWTDPSSAASPQGVDTGRGEVIQAQAHAQAEVIVATSIDTIPSVMQLCYHTSIGQLPSARSAQTPPATPVYIVNDFPVLSSYASGREHERYVSFLKQFGALNSSVTVVSRSQWVIDTASQENSDIVIQKIIPSIDQKVFYISKTELHMKSLHTTFCIMVRFRGSKAIDQTIFHSIILLLQQPDIKIRFRLLDVPSEHYMKELCSIFKDGTVTSISSKSVSSTLANANFEYINYNYTQSLQQMGNNYREADLFLDASELTGWALQRSVLEAQACGCVMVLPTGSMAQAMADNNIDECLVFETTRANKLQRLLLTYLQNGPLRSRLMASMSARATDHSCEEDGLSFLDKVSAPQTASELGSELSQFFVLSTGSSSWLHLTSLAFFFLVLCLVYRIYVRPSGNFKLYNRIRSISINEKE